MRTKLFIALFLSCMSMVNAQSLKVMTYNIRLDTQSDGVNQWSLRKEKVYQLIKKYNPEIIGMQEVLHNQLEDLKDNLQEYCSIGVGRDDGKEKGEYSTIFIKKERFEILNQNTFWLSETTEVPGSKSWDAAITRVATWARLRDKKTNKQFFILNTHFDHIGKEARKKSADLLKQRARELANNLPIIIIGDFNCTREDLPYSTMIAADNLSLQDSAPANPPGTYCSFEVNTIPCRAIDYIFYSKEWTTAAYRVIQDNDGKHYPSDHLPVMVEFNLAKK